MNIQLGNLQLKDVVVEKYLEKIQIFLDTNGYKHTYKCDDIEKKEGNYHIFDIPRQIHICGDGKTQDFIKFLKKENLIGNGFKGTLGVGCIELNKTQDKE